MHGQTQPFENNELILRCSLRNIWKIQKRRKKIYMFYPESCHSKTATINNTAYFFPVCFLCKGILFGFGFLSCCSLNHSVLEF